MRRGDGREPTEEEIQRVRQEAVTERKPDMPACHRILRKCAGK